jgi:four helix bundle protein
MERQRPQQDIKDRTFAFAVEIVRLCQELDGKPGTNRRLAAQLLSSGTSIGANIEEAQAGQSVADFVSKCSIALKEARETIYWLRLLEATGLSKNQNIQTHRQEAVELSRILGSIIVRTKNRRRGG